MLPLPLPPAHSYYLRSWCYRFRSPLLIVTTCARGAYAALPSISGSRASAGGSKCRQPPPRCPPLYFRQQGVGRRQQMPPAPAPLPSPLLPATRHPASNKETAISRLAAASDLPILKKILCLVWLPLPLPTTHSYYLRSWCYRFHSPMLIITTCARGATASAPP